jgi:hypothetical protein
MAAVRLDQDSARPERRSDPADGFAAGLERAVPFEAVQDWIHDSLAYGDCFVGAGANGMDDLVAVHLVLLKETKDEEFRNAVHEVRIGIAGRHGKTIP